MAVKMRSAAGIARFWLATVAGASATAWVAIDRAGRDISGAGVSSVTAASLGASSDTTAPGSNPSPSVTIGSPTAASQTPRDRSATVAGGQVSARCTGETILLRIAQPSNGWRVDVKESGPRAVDLVFERGGEDAEGRTRVTALCENGTPGFTVANSAVDND